MDNPDVSSGRDEFEGSSPATGDQPSRTAGRVAKRLVSYLRTGVTSGALPAALGVRRFVRAARSLGGGDRRRGLWNVVVGGAWIAAAVGLRRYFRGSRTSRGVDQTDVVATSPDIEEVTRDEAGDRRDADADEPDADAEDAGGIDRSDVVDTGPGADDVEAVETDSSEEEETADEAGADDSSGSSEQ